MSITSSNIKVFPSNRRNDQIDRNARLFSEQNITGIIKGITKKNFVISGLEVINNVLQPGECSIGGYYFKIDTTQVLDNTNDSYAYFKIVTKPITITTDYVVANPQPRNQEDIDLEIYYTRSGSGTEESSYTYTLATTFDSSIATNHGYYILPSVTFNELLGNGNNTIDYNNQFQGLQLIYFNTIQPEQSISGDITTYNLLLAIYDTQGNEWITNIDNTLKYTEEDAYLDDGEIE